MQINILSLFYFIYFSDIIIFKQQYPQNINSVQENMIYGTSEKNNYKK